MSRHGFSIDADQLFEDTKTELQVHRSSMNSSYNSFVGDVDQIFESLVRRVAEGVAGALAMALENGCDQIYDKLQNANRCLCCGSPYEVPELREEIEQLRVELRSNAQRAETLTNAAIDATNKAVKELKEARAPWDAANGLAGMDAGAGD